MRIIPDSIINNHNSRAEEKVFSALKNYTNKYGQCVALHSCLLPNHDYKRVGEADFVIVSTFGVFVLEVKGGGIKQEEGQWYTTNHEGTHLINNPFEQASSAVHAIKKSIGASLTIERPRIPIGYAVVFPDVSWNQTSTEWDSETVCDARNMQDFDLWLDNVFEYWNDRPNNDNFLADNDVEHIVNFLRPNFELIPPLFKQIYDIKEQAIKLTKEQYHFVDIAMDNKRVLCSGGAGTGKTFLAVEMARRFSNQDKIVLVVCKSLWLRHYLNSIINSEKVIITHMAGLKNTVRREHIAKVDVLIIDEGQDVLNFADLDQLGALLQGGFNGGQWYLFHDSKNQSNLIGNMDKKALEWLKEKNYPTNLKLNVNCRNTSNILTNIQKKLGTDLERPALAEGPEVTEYTGTKNELAIQLSVLLSEISISELDLGSITILSKKNKGNSLLSCLSEPELYDIVSLDEYSIRTYNFSKINFAKIDNFKGLENDVIILLDLQDPSQISKEKSLASHYVGMSRARTKLYCFWDS